MVLLISRAHNNISNSLFHFLLRRITEEPKSPAKPTTTQKWMKNKQAGDGAVVLCNWMLHIQKGGDRFKKVTKITDVIRSIWGLPAMDFTTRNICTEYENTKNMKQLSKNSTYQI